MATDPLTVAHSQWALSHLLRVAVVGSVIDLEVDHQFGANGTYECETYGYCPGAARFVTGE